MTPIEALANRKPLVATRCGGPDDIVHAGNGLLVPVDDVQALAAAMEQMRNAYRRFDPGALRADALSRFGVASVACRFESWYRGLLDGRQMIVNRWNGHHARWRSDADAGSADRSPHPPGG